MIQWPATQDVSDFLCFFSVSFLVSPNLARVGRETVKEQQRLMQVLLQMVLARLAHRLRLGSRDYRQTRKENEIMKS